MKYNFFTELKFTSAYKEYINAHPAIREAMCLKAQYPDYFDGITEGDLLAGRIQHGLIGFSPDEWGPTAFGYYCLTTEIEKHLKENDYSTEQRTEIEEILEFWSTENTSFKLRSRYTEEMKKYLPSDDWMNQSGIAFPLYRLTGGTPDFSTLLKLGIPGLRDKITKLLESADAESKDPDFYRGLLIALDVFVNVIDFYIDNVKQLLGKETGQSRISDLEKLLNVLEAVKISKPRTFHEALQLFWLYTFLGDVRNYGRMDMYMGDFLASDIDNGIITEEEALRLVQSLWKLMVDRHTVVHNRVIIGGRGRRNEKNADRFAMLALEASRTVLAIEPQLSLRIYKGMNPEVYEKALDVIGEGRTFPILYNDDVNIGSVVKAFEFNKLDAEQYVPYGCGEYIIEHESFGTPSGVINLLKALEVTLHNGIDPMTGKEAGLALGDFNSFKSFGDLWNAYNKQVEHFVRLMAEQEVLEYKVAGETAPFLFMSMLYGECLDSGKGMFSGGIKYLGGTLETYGNTNTSDSLLAIKKLVYESNSVPKGELLQALDSDFEGYELLRKKLLDVPKYGNDNNEADNMVSKVHEHVCTYVREQKDRVGLHSYLVVNINNSANTLMGHSTSASADGRKSCMSMNNGNNPTSGYDKNGVTAMLNSLVKPRTDIHAGAVQNLKFSKNMFREKRDILKSLLQTYFDNGGAQAMITVVDKDDLRSAMKEPEKYQHIFVRVGGFSARFVELARDIQEDILTRTLY
ncbi:MAG: hypothetical protein JW995_03195 [Melioribacteraceae bacterium]|nr:hypothetical protein [Melioribacteraceae bacterium]